MSQSYSQDDEDDERYKGKSKRFGLLPALSEPLLDGDGHQGPNYLGRSVIGRVIELRMGMEPRKLPQHTWIGAMKNEGLSNFSNVASGTDICPRSAI